MSWSGVEYLALSDVDPGVQPDLAPAIWRVTHAYAYDSNGNRTMAPNLIGKPAPVYDAQDRMLSYGDCNYSYKRDGSLQSKICPGGTTTYDYDALGNLRHVGMPDGTAIDYIIDGQNRRVGKKVNGMVEGFVYRSQLQPTTWLNGDGSIKATFVYGLRANVPEYMVKGGTTYRLITDQLGSVRLVENASTGAVIERLDYDEYGVVLTNTNADFLPFSYAGGLCDTLATLSRFGARDYDQEVGRWTSKDSLRFGGGDSDLYAYAANDPVNLFDLDGMESGRRFSGPDGRNAAAIDSLLWLLAHKKGAQEWGGNMCKLKGLNTYFCTQPVPGPTEGGSIDPSTFNQCPAPWSDPVADYHSHPVPGDPKPPDRDPFSQGDVLNAFQCSLPPYVGVPTNAGDQLWMYNIVLQRSFRVYP